MKRVATHLLAGILGWWAVASWTRHAPVESELANKDRSGTRPVAVRPAEPSPNIRQRFLNEWEKRVGEPVVSGADLEVKRRTLERLFMEWLQVDPMSALAHFDEQVLPGQHNTIRNALGTANPADAELIFREVDRVESVAFYKLPTAWQSPTPSVASPWYCHVPLAPCGEISWPACFKARTKRFSNNCGISSQRNPRSSGHPTRRGSFRKK
jgi:hypothetical protein